MSGRAVHWALWDAPMLKTEAGHNDPTSRFVLVALAEKARGEPLLSFPSLTTLHVMTGLDHKTIERALDRLSFGGLIADAGMRHECTIWRLDTSRKRTESDLAEMDQRREREQALTRERVRRWRERRRQHAEAVTDSASVTRSAVTDSASVTGGGVTDFASPVTDFASVTHSALRTNQKDEPRDSPSIPPQPSPVEDGLLPLAALAETDAGCRQAPTGAGSDTAVAFAAFWAVYPRRVGKLDAERKFQKALKEGTDPADIIAGATRYAEFRNGQDSKYTKHPATWLNQGCWTDEPDRSPSTAISNGYQPWKNPTDQSVYDEELY